MRPTTPCVEFDGHRTERGYGRVNKRVNGRIVSQYVHRLVWEAINGPIPEGMVVMHRCDNPACYRLDHLQLGTQADNLADMCSKRRHWAHKLQDA